jgi:aspartyl protease family protein
MPRNVVIVGLAAAVLAAIPAIYQSYPGLLQGLLAPSTEVPTEPANPAPARKEAVGSPSTEVLSGKKVRLSADARGHFTAAFKLNGRSVAAMVDTGATAVAINRTTARRIGLRLDRDDFRYEVRTANGITHAASVTIDRMQIGRIFVENVQAAVLDDSALNGTLIGMSFLSRLSKFQIEDGALLLVQ